ncbi:putative PEP-binding protein [Marinobacter pelagius]|uniref:Phosphoenolpyruvate synthase n=1 Tax=Marinobacter pelagius TaxID=379482 RepID=A0A1I4W8R8_9GAMM|nr:putative PEP-binding protein [Marinobacter pelagius]SFN09379.1 phosphoenolpyruvate synthase [Marinobacter pelagius]
MAVRDRQISNEEYSGQSPEAPALPTPMRATKCRRVSSVPNGCLNRFSITHRGRELARGIAIGTGVSTGTVCKAESLQAAGVCPDHCVLVCADTGPEWLPVLERANAVVTEHGTRTSHTAIACRELGIPAIVNAGEAITRLRNGDPVTVSCAEGDEGFVYEGFADIQVSEINPDSIPTTRTRIMLNLANPTAALRWQDLPADGIGLARMEFLIRNLIGVHPMALLYPERITNKEERKRISALTAGWQDPGTYLTETLAQGIAQLAASQYPKPVTIRTSDFKTNEQVKLIGGRDFEPLEANPMLGWRGASRYYSAEFREAFALECQAIRTARDELAMDNLRIMIPFCRTPEEADKVLEELSANGLVRGERGLAVYMTAEVPANIELADEFSERFDGFSIGTNDLTQLTFGVDRDSERLSELFNDHHETIKRMIARLIDTAHRHGREVGLCGQAPSDHPEFAAFLVNCGIDFLSVSPDSFLRVKEKVAQAESAGAAP